MTTTIQWESLNDVFAEGDTEVWYMKPEWFRKGIMGDRPNPTNLETTHALLGKIAPSPSTSYSTENLDKLWYKLQGEFWSPNGEARTMIQDLGLQHTSMSVGDCFKLANGEIWMVAASGFELIFPHQRDI